VANPIEELRKIGQSLWLDYISRRLITSGEMERMVRGRWITGMTSNPTIFQKAIAESDDYNEAVERARTQGISDPYEGFLEICGEDVRTAADVLRSVYDETQGDDGYVSFEAQDGTTEAIAAEARRMFKHVGRPNVMIKVPGTPTGVRAVPQLIADGLNINITLLFDVDVYEQVAEAYISGLEKRLEAGRPLRDVASVASFFVSRVDTKVDPMLPEDSPLRGKVAIANARFAYKRFKEIFAGPRWEKLASEGARLQRPLWGSTGTKNKAYSDILYVEELIAPHTVNTVPESTLRAFLDHGKVRPSIQEGLAESEEVLRQLPSAGIDLKAVTTELLEEGLEAFRKDHEKLLEEIGRALRAAQAARAG
jgi:transaldolase/glucose-6-phosphate isomerase